MPELPIPLQTDVLTTLPGGGVRTLTAIVGINGVPTSVQMQVVSIAGPNGELIDTFVPVMQLNDILNVMRDIKKLLLMQQSLLQLDGELDRS